MNTNKTDTTLADLLATYRQQATHAEVEAAARAPLLALVGTLRALTGEHGRLTYATPSLENQRALQALTLRLTQLASDLDTTSQTLVTRLAQQRANLEDFLVALVSATVANPEAARRLAKDPRGEQGATVPLPSGVPRDPANQVPVDWTLF